MYLIILILIWKDGEAYSKPIRVDLQDEKLRAADCKNPSPGPKFEIPIDCNGADVDVPGPNPELDLTILENRPYEQKVLKTCKVMKSVIDYECWKGYVLSYFSLNSYLNLNFFQDC